MKRTYFHGTSADHLEAILRDGLRPDCGKVWDPSLDEVYLWSPDKLAEIGECEDGTDAEWEAKRRAYDSAQCALALCKSGKCVVFELELDDSLVTDDMSCENMSGAVATSEAIPPSAIKRVWISPDLSLLRGYFIGLCLSNRQFPSHRFSEIEKKIAKAISEAEIYPEVDSEYPLEEMARV